MVTRPKTVSLASRAAAQVSSLSAVLATPEIAGALSALNVMRIEVVIAACKERVVDREILGFNEKLDRPHEDGGFTSFFKEVWAFLGPAQQRGLRKLFYDAFNQIV